ncbi:unnamed protein product [Brassicogethes aeneus]|uniref:G-protein coupled receptors family 1 profile domain-containing protein n=1 Tax=Brassicogethes aeneus TaxID=1431903 RepID=A0A9P0FEU3_BRAAE|nr:unnamed protein product [Brassicogethes aeneus]
MKSNYLDQIKQQNIEINSIHDAFEIPKNHTQLNNSFENFTSDIFSFNSTDWGPKRDPLYIVIPISFMYVLTFVSGLLGNISTCIVIAKNKPMHTATNYYLFSLAISDLLLLISGLPPEIYAIWTKYPYIFGEAFCVLQGFAAETSANATVLTITAFTIERYVAICHPFLSHTLSKLNRAIKFIIAIWIVAICLAVPLAMAFGVWCEQLPDGSFSDEQCVCMVKRIVLPHAFEISTFVFFIAPMSLITVLYILIGLQLHRSTVGPSRGNSVKLKHRVYKPVTTFPNSASQAVVMLNGEGEKQNSVQEEEGRKNFAKNAQATKHVVKMLVAVVVAFFICWAPFHAQRLLAIYGKHTSARMIKAFQILTYISGVFYYLSTTVNPLLYHIMSHKFREAFKNTYKNCGRKGHRFPGGRCYSTLSTRSSQVNSHSITDSYSHQSTLRYLDAEMARLHDSRRPLVVSFRRKKANLSPRRTKQIIILDENLQDALNNLDYASRQNYLRRSRQDLNNHISVHDDLSNSGSFRNECSFIEIHKLKPTHICPLSTEFSKCTRSKTESSIEELRMKTRSFEEFQVDRGRDNFL